MKKDHKRKNSWEAMSKARTAKCRDSVDEISDQVYKYYARS